MSAPTGKDWAEPSGVWPTDTLSAPEKSMFLNDDGITSMHERAAHSDGDLILLFRRADVIMAGDIVNTDHFPVLEVDKGGSLQGEIAALNHLIRLAIPPTPLVWKMGGTLVVPGHGYICDQADLVEYRDMLVIIRDIVQDLIAQGKTLAQVQEANPTAGYRSRYGSDSGPWTTDMFVEAVYRSLTAEKKQGESK
jgi:glyoxylase-like metal-dependent hydrolase (beta-lactamase superfamily II)